MVENLENIKNFGIIAFLGTENKKWTCSECGGTICFHKNYCYSCGKRIGFDTTFGDNFM